MLTRRKAALLKVEGEPDPIAQQENEAPITSPVTLHRSLNHKSNKTPRAASRGDPDIERPSKRRRESPALELSSACINKVQDFDEPRKGSSTPLLATPRLHQFVAEKFEENRLWVKFLQFSLCFAFFYALFWALLIQVANLTISKHSVQLLPLPPTSQDITPSLNIFYAHPPNQYGPFMPFVIVNPSEALKLGSEHVKTILESTSRVNLDDEAIAAFLIISHTDDCESAWSHYIGVKLPIVNKGCVHIGDFDPQLEWLETSPSVSCSRGRDEGIDQGEGVHEPRQNSLECAFDV